MMKFIICLIKGHIFTYLQLERYDGSYNVMEACQANQGGGTPPHPSTVNVEIRDIRVKFSRKKKVNENTILDASYSYSDTC